MLTTANFRTVYLSDTFWFEVLFSFGPTLGVSPDSTASTVAQVANLRAVSLTSTQVSNLRYIRLGFAVCKSVYA